MRILFFISLAVLSACASNVTLPEIYVQNEMQTLEEKCRSLEMLATAVGITRLSKRERELYTPVNVIRIDETIQDDTTEVIKTVYALPVESHEDVEAIARLVYRNCTRK